MRCTIPGAHVKVFGKAVHSLSRIGEELYIEPLEHGLALRTVNSSRSAYACFVFAPAFFIHYDDGSRLDRPDAEQLDEEALKCKIGMKSCLSVFKSLSTLEKIVDKCKIHLNMENARLVFQLYCRHGIVKTYNLAFIECETLQAVFSKDMTPNVLTAQSKLLSDSVVNFQTTQEEVSLIVSPEEVCIKNYIEDEHDPKKVIHTQMTLEPDEFETYQVGIDTEVTFCLKELRAILAFTEVANLPISIHFETAGKPIVFSVNTDPSYEANFVLATLADPSTQVSCSQQASQVHRKNTSKNTSQRPSSSKRKHSSVSNGQSTSKRQATTSYDWNDDTADATNRIISNPTPKPRKQKSMNTEAMQAALNHMMNDTDLPEAPQDSAAPSTSRAFLQPSTSTAVAELTAYSESPTIPLQTTEGTGGRIGAGDVSGFLGLTEEDMEGEEEDREELVPGTPPHKTPFKSLFFGLSQASSAVGTQREAAGHPMVLAEDSDED